MPCKCNSCAKRTNCFYLNNFIIDQIMGCIEYTPEPDEDDKFAKKTSFKEYEDYKTSYSKQEDFVAKDDLTSNYMAFSCCEICNGPIATPMMNRMPRYICPECAKRLKKLLYGDESNDQEEND